LSEYYFSAESEYRKYTTKAITLESVEGNTHFLSAVEGMEQNDEDLG